MKPDPQAGRLGPDREPAPPDATGGPRPVGDWFQAMPLTGSHWTAGSVLFGAFVFESWEMMILVLNAGAIAAEWGLDTRQTGSLIGSLFLGMIPGALLWGRLSGSLGRRTCAVASLALYAPIPLLSAFAPSFEVLWWLRFAGGVALAGALVVTFPYFEELVPARLRGRATVYLSAGWPVGLLVAVGVTAALADAGWRAVIGLSSVSLLWAVAIHRLVPESPYWLATRGRHAEAATVIGRLSRGRISASTLPPPAGTGRSEPFAALFRGPVLRLTLLQMVVNFCFAWGYWALATWMPALLAQRGLSAPEGLGFIAVSALFMFPGYLAASYLTGRFGRKRTMTAFVLVAAIAGFAFAGSATRGEMYFWNFTLSFFSLGAWGVWNTWLAEIYDTRLRGMGVAWGVTMQRVANALAPVAIGATLESSSFLRTVSLISAFLGCTFVAALFLPETEGKALE